MAANGGNAYSKSSGKVSLTSQADAWGSPGDAAILTALERLARSIRGLIVEQVAQQVEAERRTINVRVIKEAETKADQLLQTNKEWVQAEKQRLYLLHKRGEEVRRWLNWLLDLVRRATNTVIFFLLWGAIAASWGWIGGINTPSAIICRTRTSLCYQMRIRALKSAIADNSAPKCHKTRKGIVCLLPNSKDSQPSLKPPVLEKEEESEL